MTEFSHVRFAGGQAVARQQFGNGGVRSPFLTERGDDLFCRIQRLNFWRRHGINSVTAWLASMELNGIIIGIGWKTFGIWPATSRTMTRNERGNRPEFPPAFIVAMDRKSRGLSAPMARNWKPLIHQGVGRALG